jgi:formate-dependent nitrite reductase membrane component NrfD
MDAYSSVMFLRRLRDLFSLLRAGVALGMICIILGLAPFAVAQDVHHELAAADSDGHEHSDTDICQWVQHHIAGSVDLDVPRFTLCDIVRQQELPSESVLLSAALSLIGPSRAPPQV